jgi:hypothetical protein
LILRIIHQFASVIVAVPSRLILDLLPRFLGKNGSPDRVVARTLRHPTRRGARIADTSTVKEYQSAVARAFRAIISRHGGINGFGWTGTCFHRVTLAVHVNDRRRNGRRAIQAAIKGSEEFHFHRTGAAAVVIPNDGDGNEKGYYYLKRSYSNHPASLSRNDTMYAQ